jgi:hypothetical protein
VYRLSGLRKHSLLINAVCNRWKATQQTEFALVERGALLTWRVVRVVTAWLFAWPNRRFHPEPSTLASLALACNAWVHAVLYKSDAARLRWLIAELGRLDREIATIRALTSSPEINDMLSRDQAAFNWLTARLRAATYVATVTPSSEVITHQRLAISVTQDHWPHFSA